MKIVLVNHSDSRGGASVVSMRLVEALRSAGHDARMLVVHNSTGSDFVATAAPHWRARLPFLAEHLRIFTANGMNRADLFKASTATDGLPLSRHPLVKQADVVMLGWINQGMLSLDEIRRIAAMGKRMVWTMHDMWNMTGICHHAGSCSRYMEAEGCRRCPLLHGRAADNDLAASTFRRKSQLYAETDITFVAVSSWLAERCRQSSLMKGCDVRVIPNAFPIDVFHIAPKLSRAEAGLPQHGKLIVMGAARLDDPVKGFPYAIESLNILAKRRKDVSAVFFGNLRHPDVLQSLHLPYVWLGPLSGKERIAEIYAHADVVMSTSLYETLPGTLIEGQAAGAMPVTFDRGGQRDIIRASGEGFLVPFGDNEAFAAALAQAIDHPSDRRKLHELVAGRFGAGNIARAYLQMFS